MLEGVEGVTSNPSILPSRDEGPLVGEAHRSRPQLAPELLLRRGGGGSDSVPDISRSEAY